MEHQPVQGRATTVFEPRLTRPFWTRVGPGAVRFAKMKPVGAAGGLLMLAMAFMAAFAPWISPFDPVEVHTKDRVMAPFSTGIAGFYLLGTDELGRDLLSRTIYGARTSVTVGVLAVAFGTSMGAIIGILCAYIGGKFDLIVQRFVDAMFAFPLLIFALAIVAVLGQSMANVIIALAIVIVPGESRIIRGTALSVMQTPYIDATRAIGCGALRTLTLHVLPNVTAVIIVLASLQLGTAIIVEASLSFLGLGTPPPTPSWGGMLSGSSRNFLEIAPHLALVPGIAISLAVLGINLLGDAIRDLWDPRLRGSQ